MIKAILRIEAQIETTPPSTSSMKCVKRINLQIENNRMSMTQDNRTFNRSPGESALSVVEQRPKASSQTCDL